MNKYFLFKHFFDKTISKLNNKEFAFILFYGFCLRFLSKGKYRLYKKKSIAKSRKYKLIIKGEDVFFDEPLELTKERKKLKHKELSIGYRMFENARISPDVSFVYDGFYCFYQKLTTYAKFEDIVFESDTIMIDVDQYVLVDHTRDEITNLKEGIFFGGSWPTNWYHLLIEILSKIEVVKNLPQEYKKYPIILSKEAYALENQKELIDKILYGFNFVLVSSNRTTQVGSLLHLDSPILLPPNYRNGACENTIDYNINKKLTKQYMERIFDLYNLDVNEDFKYVYLARSQHKRKYNQDEITGYLKKIGFKVVYLEQFSLIQQASIFRSADCIIGPTGAAWSNIVFSNKNQKGIIFLPEAARSSTVYSKLSQIVGIELYHLYYKSESANWVEYMVSSEVAKIEIDDLKEYIKQLGLKFLHD